MGTKEKDIILFKKNKLNEYKLQYARIGDAIQNLKKLHEVVELSRNGSMHYYNTEKPYEKDELKQEINNLNLVLIKEKKITEEEKEILEKEIVKTRKQLHNKKLVRNPCIYYRLIL